MKVVRSEDEDEEGTKDPAARQDVNFFPLKRKQISSTKYLGAKTGFLWQR